MPLGMNGVLEVYRAVLGREDVVPGMVAGMQTHAWIANWHPRIHALVSYGVSTEGQ